MSGKMSVQSQKQTAKLRRRRPQEACAQPKKSVLGIYLLSSHHRCRFGKDVSRSASLACIVVAVSTQDDVSVREAFDTVNDKTAVVQSCQYDATSLQGLGDGFPQHQLIFSITQQGPHTASFGTDDDLFAICYLCGHFLKEKRIVHLPHACPIGPFRPFFSPRVIHSVIPPLVLTERAAINRWVNSTAPALGRHSNK